MPSIFFAGNKTNSGGALFATFNSKDQCAFFRLIKQTAWNETSSQASFAGGESFNVKFSHDEICDFIRAVREKDRSKFYHEFNGDVTSGNLGYYSKDYTDKNGKPAKSQGFGLTVKKANVEIKVGLSLGSAERLSRYLQFADDHINSAIYTQDKKEAEEYLKKKDATNKSNKVAVKKEPVKETPVEDADPVVDENVNPPEIVEGGEDNLNW